jgi:hypothetical protein
VQIRSIRFSGIAFLFIVFVPFAIYARANDGFVSGGGVPCVWRTVTGFPCPGCGLTRSLAAVSNFDVVSSIRFNVEGLLIIVFAVLAVIAPRQVKALSRRMNERFAGFSMQKSMWIGFGIFSAVWVVNIWRVWSGFYPSS